MEQSGQPSRVDERRADRGRVAVRDRESRRSFRCHHLDVRPTRGLEVRATGSIELVIRYSFAARDGGTHMTGVYDFRPRGALKVLFALMKPVIAGNVKKQSASFKALCERRAGD